MTVDALEAHSMDKIEWANQLAKEEQAFGKPSAGD